MQRVELHWVLVNILIYFYYFFAKISSVYFCTKYSFIRNVCYLFYKFIGYKTKIPKNVYLHISQLE